MELGGEEAAGHSSSSSSSRERDILVHGEDPSQEPLLPSSSSRVGNQNPALFRGSSRPSNNSNTGDSLNGLLLAGESGNTSGRQDGQNAHNKNKSSWHGFLECFSLILNMDKLVAPSREGNEFGALDGVRTLSMMWVVLGHVLIYALAGPGFTNIIDVLPRHGEGLLARFGDIIFFF